MSGSIEVVTIKEEVGLHDEYLLEDDIKIEETCLQNTSEHSFVPMIVPSVIVERKLLICSMCKCAFERKANIKPQYRLDVSKCYKCILHSRLREVFNGAARRKKRKCLKERSLSRNAQSDVVVVDSDSTDSDSENTQTQSISVTKIMYVCIICKNQFERNNSTGLKQPSDWYKCNRCILHSRLNTVFQPNKPKKRKY